MKDDGVNVLSFSREMRDEKVRDEKVRDKEVRDEEVRDAGRGKGCGG